MLGPKSGSNAWRWMGTATELGTSAASLSVGSLRGLLLSLVPVGSWRWRRGQGRGTGGQHRGVLSGDHRPVRQTKERHAVDHYDFDAQCHA